MNQITDNSTMPSGVGIFAAGYGIFLLAIAVVLIAALWKVFEKAGEQGWKALIPVYSSYMLYKIAWDAKAFWIVMVLGLLSGFLGLIPLLGMVLGFIGGLLAGLIEIFCCIKLAKAFGHSGWFAAGLIFLSPIFILILGFDQSEYIGPQQ